MQNKAAKQAQPRGGGIWGYFWGEVRVPWGWEEHFGVPPEQRGGPITLRGGRGRRRRLRAAVRGGRGGRRRRGLDRGRGRPLQGGPQRPPPTGSSRLCARRETSERVGQFQGEGDVDLEGEQMQEGPPPGGPSWPRDPHPPPEKEPRVSPPKPSNAGRTQASGQPPQKQDPGIQVPPGCQPMSPLPSQTCPYWSKLGCTQRRGGRGSPNLARASVSPAEGFGSLRKGGWRGWLGLAGR